MNIFFFIRNSYESSYYPRVTIFYCLPDPLTILEFENTAWFRVTSHQQGSDSCLQWFVTINKPGLIFHTRDSIIVINLCRHQHQLLQVVFIWMWLAILIFLPKVLFSNFSSEDHACTKQLRTIEPVSIPLSDGSYNLWIIVLFSSLWIIVSINIVFHIICITLASQITTLLLWSFNPLQFSSLTTSMAKLKIFKCVCQFQSHS